MPELISPLELVPEEEPHGNQVDPEGVSDSELEAIRELVLRAHPDIVPELVSGSTVANLLASVEPARAAWVRLADRFAEHRPAEVPAGGGLPIAIDPDRMPAAEKIRRGIATASRKGYRMAITKAQAASLSNNMLLRGVIETIVKESQILNFLPFMEVTGTSLTYTREATMPAVSFYGVGDTWAEATPTFSTVNANLAIIGGDADVDNFLQATYADANDVEAEVIASRAKAVAHKFSETFITGDTSTDPKSFNGIHKLIPSGQTLTMGSNGGALTLAKLDELIDAVKPGKPELLLMSKRTRRKLKDLRRSAGYMLETTVNQFGQQVETYDGIPLIVDDFVPDTQTLGSGTNLSSIYALKFGHGAGLMGVEHGGIQIERVGELETMDATRTRIKWYVGLALFSELGCAKLEGISAV